MSNKKVLVIDDNPVVVRLNESLLTSSGYEVLTANDGLLGFEKAKNEKPDVILLDIILPGIHGFDLCKQLKEHPETSHIPVIIITGSGLEEVLEEEPTIQADAILSKPYGPDDLSGVMNKVMKQGEA